MAIQTLTKQEISAVSGGASVDLGLVGGLLVGLFGTISGLTGSSLVSGIANIPLVKGLTGAVNQLLVGVLRVVGPLAGSLLGALGL